MGFETAKSGLNISQKGLDIVGNNLTNIDTAGYTRQRLDVTSIAPSSFSTRVATSRIGLTGQGVQALGVGQTRDEFLDKRFRDEYSTSGYYSQATSILSDIEYALGDAADVSLGGDVFTQALRQIYESLNDFSGSPTSTPHANLVLSAFTNATQVLQMLDDKLNDVAEQQVYDLGLAVDDVNTILAQIAELNKAISQDATARPGQRILPPQRAARPAQPAARRTGWLRRYPRDQFFRRHHQRHYGRARSSHQV